ncbi:hypothetical protein POM88_035594 [Heracleum sosnowskyi]|uniref:Uncharacterized protein n=1 Tax=Heracleum sosnowskyi TaxID=360622 RepID=A0AAD8HLL4_9APIA|nr:hypothetical protein POM88_035591 [Heracleum sosnowskyi]KAK1369502.1 hypothetical protein POM88_035594 [Heracleum sosnowskyi]
MSLLGLSPDEAKSVELIGRGEKHKFIKLVDHIMQKCCNGRKMNSFLIRFPLSRKEESHITSWISNAVMMGVETIHLDLRGACTNIILESSRGRGGITDWKYTFPFSVQTVLGKACVVKHLRLTSCGLRSLSPLNSLASLIVIEIIDHTDDCRFVVFCFSNFTPALIKGDSQN